MKLRARLLLTIVAVAIPIALGLAAFGLWSARRAVVDATYEATLSRMESGGRELCEDRPGVFSHGGPGFGRPGRALEGPRARHVRRRRLRRIRRERSGRWGRARLVGVYSDEFTPLLARTPSLDADLRGALEGGDDIAARWSGSTRPRARIAMRMPWDGPCSILVVDRTAGPALGAEGLLRSLGFAALLVLLTAFVALFALGPVVRRVRQLTQAVRAQESGGYAGDVAVEGKDEVAELARAFNDASSQIRERMEELSHRDQALTEFLQSTTHDVMVPLTVLQGHLSELAKADRPDEQDGDIDRVRAALEEAHYVAALLRNLSAAARLDAGEPMLSRHDLDLRDVVERVVSRHGPIAKARGIALNHAVPEEAVRVHADSTLLEQAIGNLVHNAIRYNRAGGHVAVILETTEEGFLLRVKDDGPGIPEEELANVAERRFRGGEARKRSPTGLGLGLHIVRDVAEKHHYTLRFESPDEGGLTVHLQGS